MEGNPTLRPPSHRHSQTGKTWQRLRIKLSAISRPNHAQMIATVKEAVVRSFRELMAIDYGELPDRRFDKYRRIGVYGEGMQ